MFPLTPLANTAIVERNSWALAQDVWCIQGPLNQVYPQKSSLVSLVGTV